MTMNKLTEEQIAEISGRLRNGDVTLADLAVAYEKTPVVTRQKLTTTQVKEICEQLCKEGATVKAVAEKYNVSYWTIEGIRRQKTYTNITKKYDFGRVNNRLSAEDVESICLLLEEGAYVPDLARAFKVTGQTIHNIRLGKTWTGISSKYEFQ